MTTPAPQEPHWQFTVSVNSDGSVVIDADPFSMTFDKKDWEYVLRVTHPPASVPKHGDCPDCPILTGPDALRFHRYIDEETETPCTPKGIALIKRANELAKTFCFDPEKRKARDTLMRAEGAKVEREQIATFCNQSWFEVEDDDGEIQEVILKDDVLESLRSNQQEDPQK